MRVVRKPHEKARRHKPQVNNPCESDSVKALLLKLDAISGVTLEETKLNVSEGSDIDPEC